MEVYILSEDIDVICVPAQSFPDGVKAAHEKLHSMIPFTTERRYFGISWGSEKGAIHYQAAAEILSPDDANLKDTVPFTIWKGKYMSIVIEDFMKDIPAIGRAFEELLSLDMIDPEGYCLEWYISNKDVRCMVPLS